jgi:hypothetical protein
MERDQSRIRLGQRQRSRLAASRSPRRESKDAVNRHWAQTLFAARATAASVSPASIRLVARLCGRAITAVCVAGLAVCCRTPGGASSFARRPISAVFFHPKELETHAYCSENPKIGPSAINLPQEFSAG